MELSSEEKKPVKKFSLFKKFIVAFLAIIFFAVLMLWGIGTYKEWQAGQDVKKMAEGLKQWEQEQYQKAMADTFGGKTPQETLQMYIEAVEKGDYELASKYLIESKKQNETEAIKALKEKNNLDLYLSILKKAKADGAIADNSFRMKSQTREGSYYYIKFIKYPNNIWKIIEI